MKTHLKGLIESKTFVINWECFKKIKTLENSLFDLTNV